MGLSESLHRLFDSPVIKHNSEITICGISNNYLTCWEKESLLSQTSIYDKRKCTFKVEMSSMDRMNIRTSHGTYLSAEKAECISQVITDKPGDKEGFFPVYLETGDFAIRTFEDRYLFCTEDFRVKTVPKDEFNDMCRFRKYHYLESPFN